MTWQVRIVNIRTGGIMVCGVTADTMTDAWRKLAYLPGAGGRLDILSIRPIPGRRYRDT
jgi:hypothetical protein